MFVIPLDFLTKNMSILGSPKTTHKADLTGGCFTKIYMQSDTVAIAMKWDTSSHVDSNAVNTRE